MSPPDWDEERFDGEEERGDAEGHEGPRFDDGEDALDVGVLPARWPLHPDGLLPRERWMWFEQLWEDICRLRERYHLPVRSGWWEDDIQIEALAALAAWVERYDSGEWDDPPGKLGLLFDLERIGSLLRDGRDPFHPRRDRTPFIRFLLGSGCEPPEGWD